MEIEVSFDAAMKAAKKNKEKGLTLGRLQGLTNLAKPKPQMANEPAIDKVMLTLQLSVADKRRLAKEAEKRGFESLSDYVRFLIHEATKDVVLMPEDYEAIADQIRKNQAKRDAKRVG